MKPLALFLGSVVAIAACTPEFAERESLITRTQVIAVRAEPAEAKPEEATSYDLLVATPEGPVTLPTSWAFCATPKLLTENGAVSAACTTTGVRPIAEGPARVASIMPADACFLFGPEVSSADLRPRDADITGGYYQPVRATVFGKEGGTVAFGLHRVRCKLSRAGSDIANDFDKRYLTNTNPTLLPLEARLGSAPVSFTAIPRGAKITLRASWTPESAERYPSFDVISQTIIDRRESLRVSWFTTGGTFVNDRTGRTEDEGESFTENEWTAPDEPRTLHLFFVLRDARGGVAWSTQEIQTR